MPVHGGPRRHRVEAPPCGVAAEHLGAADIEAQPRRVMHAFGQRRHIAKAQVEAQSRQRVQHMGGIAHQRQTGCCEILRQIQGQRVAVAARDQLHLSQVLAEAQAEFGLEFRLRQGQQALALGLPLRPDQ